MIGVIFLVAAGTFFSNALYEVPVLMYHHVDHHSEGSSVYVSPQTFELQMSFLKVHGYEVIGLGDYIKRLRRGDRFSKKTVVITFDDGYEDNMRHAFPILRKMGFPAVIFMITENIGQRDWLSAEDLKIMSDSGVTIGSHTTAHAFLPDIQDPKILYEELVNSKKELESILNAPVTVFSYPAGGVDARAEAFVERAGYEGAVTTNYAVKSKNPYALRRIKISDAGGNLFNFWIKVSGFYHLGKKGVVPRTAYDT